ncbi:hypothetical protein F5Y14DRAFT_129911 [Nemania sp. NC0429]|nr:hypothetical protein F5Y14DRAFT_129911 [Nemania sp. NC0429]
MSAVADIIRLNRDDFEGPDQKEESVYAVEILVDDNGAVTKIRIRSEQLLRILQDVMGTDLVPDSLRSMVIARPFKAILSFEYQLEKKRAELERELEDQAFHDSSDYPEATTESVASSKLVNSDNKRVTHQHLDILLQSFLHDLAVDYAVYSSMRRRSDELVTFAHLWYLFQPGDTIVEGRGGSAQAYRVLNVHEMAKSSHDTAEGLQRMISMLSISCFYIGYNGKTFGPVTKSFTIGHFHGRRSVTSLPIIPIEHLKQDGIHDLLIRRGSKFRSFSTPRHQTYAGMTIDELPTEIDGEVMVDIELYYRDHPDMISPSFGVIGVDEEASIIDDDRKLENHLSERFLERNEELLRTFSYHRDKDRQFNDKERLMLMPNLVWAFYLRGQKWHALDVNMVYDVIYPYDAFDYLVLPAGHKAILSSLISVHQSPKSMQSNRPDSDLVIGKGKGLIMLYHGPPGVGKTSTAECLAAYAKKPLFPITAATIGITPQEVESSLHTIFGLSQRWGCILLFDEADIVLQARDRSDFERNALVSVFLRALEYYTGILIMTTNRVGTIDEAFKSRIHVVLYFPQLDREQYMKIWEIALQRVKNQKNITIKTSQIMKFVRREWRPSMGRRMNGRDIQNAVQSAVALAEYDAKRQGDNPILTPDHIETVSRMSNDFDKYMTSVHGMSASDQAVLTGDRNDNEGNDDVDEDEPRYASRSSRRAGPKALYTMSQEIGNLTGEFGTPEESD